MFRAIALAVFACLLSACSESLEPARPVPVAEPPAFSWLEGCWMTQDGAYREVWQRGGSDLLFGFATMSHEGEVVFFEQMRIEADTPAFYAYPAGKGPSPFPLESSGSTEAVFANPNHDYPQRIRYAREGSGLVATISLADGSRPNRWAFTPCGSGEG